MTLFFADSFPDLARKLGVRMFDKHVTDYFRGIVRNVINNRDTNDVKSNDFMQILRNTRKGDEADDNVGTNFCQVILLFFGADLDTSSSTVIFCVL